MKNDKLYVILTQTYSGIAKIIKLFTHDTYSHASLSFDDRCHEMYSFGRKFLYFPFYGIFKKENLRKGLFRNKRSKIAIYEIDVTEEQYNNAKKKVLEIKNSNNGYNIMGLLLAEFKIKTHRNKYYCSEFVNVVLSSEGVNILKRNNRLFTPEELVQNKKFKKIYEGTIKEFLKNNKKSLQ